MNYLPIRLALWGLILLLAASLSNLGSAAAADAYVPFEGEKSSWHDGFDRFDYLMDEETLDIQPFKRGEGEQFGIKDPPPGKRRCVVIVPKQAALGNPWSWRGCYWDHQPQTEVELLKRGFHVAYISANATLKPGKQWDAWYAFLTEKHGLSRKPAFVGMSRGGEYAYTWATTNPGKVSCIYADNPGVNPGRSEEARRPRGGRRAHLARLRQHRSPAGTVLNDHREHLPAVRRTDLRDGQGRKRPSSAQSARPQTDRGFHFAGAFSRPTSAPPALPGRQDSPKRLFIALKTLIATSPTKETTSPAGGRGSRECYDRYSFQINGVEGAVNVIVPKKSAPGKPWVFRADYVESATRSSIWPCWPTAITSSPGPCLTTPTGRPCGVGTPSTNC